MATIILGTVGAIFGGPLGAVLGQTVGGAIDSRIFTKTREGPRLNELAVTTSSYGMPIPRHFGKIRIAGQIIWATDLVEHRDKQGGSKGSPSTITYSYTASFAVALSSRPILDVGRIWADGKLLRGSAGDLKVGGTFRLHRGHGDQAPDPLIAAAEGSTRTPAHTGLAYAVFEDLQLSDFGNRIPALTFELIADNGALSVAQLLDGVIELHDSQVPLPGMAGISADGPPIDLLQALDPLYPADCDATGPLLTIRPERFQSIPLMLPPAATASGEGAFGGKAGHTRKRSPEPEQPLAVLRYYDLDRDYQPGVQRAPGRPQPGQPRTIELPAALNAGGARALVEGAARRAGISRQTLAWRVTEIDPRVVPGALVRTPDHPGQWRVREWEWHDQGIDLNLTRIPITDATTGLGADPGRANSSVDLAISPTQLAVLELPWDGTAARMPPQLLAVTSSASSVWPGAALFVDQGDGALQPLGPSGRRRGLIGTAQSVLEPASPVLFDRHGQVLVALVASDISPFDATMRQLAMGANRALLGPELIQFQHAEPMGGGIWRLSGLWRGRGGTETAIESHQIGERFVLLDGSGVLLDHDAVGSVPGTTIAAIGLGDAVPATSPIQLRGIGYRPLAPVHGRASLLADGSLRLTWVRRARGAWLWDDGVETPLNEQSEAWIVTYGSSGSSVASWQPAMTELAIAAPDLAALLAAVPNGAFRISQRGDRGVSEQLVIPLI